MLIDISFLAVIAQTQKQADEGNPYALSLIGNVYFDGIGTVKDEAKGIEFYKKAILKAEELDPLSGLLEEMQYLQLLALLGIISYYEEQNFEESKKWLSAAHDFALARYPKDVALGFIKKNEIYILLNEMGHHPHW